MDETKDKGELLVLANLAEQAERYDGRQLWVCEAFVSGAKPGNGS